MEERKESELELELILSSFPLQFILLSSTGANATSYSPYTKMKVSLVP